MYPNSSNRDLNFSQTSSRVILHVPIGALTHSAPDSGTSAHSSPSLNLSSKLLEQLLVTDSLHNRTQCQAASLSFFSMSRNWMLAVRVRGHGRVRKLLQCAQLLSLWTYVSGSLTPPSAPHPHPTPLPIPGPQSISRTPRSPRRTRILPGTRHSRAALSRYSAWG